LEFSRTNFRDNFSVFERLCGHRHCRGGFGRTKNTVATVVAAVRTRENNRLTCRTRSLFPDMTAVGACHVPARRRREILLPEGISPEHARPIRSETRARLVAAIARGRRWLAELIADPTASAESIANRENCSARKVNMTISLAFLAPDLVKAAVDGRLPHGKCG
jgi:hypothetical protein